jgi:hypothetical protein
VYNRNSLPTFSYPNQSSSNVTDSGGAQVTPAFGRSTGGLFWFSSLGTMFSANRAAQEAFTLNPVNDPRKLELMRCAYQQAVFNCLQSGTAPEHCPDCQAIQKKFYTGSPDGVIKDTAVGTVTSECFRKTCWFHWGCRKCLPKNCDCLPVGHYCGCYVWVLPDGRDELTKLTLAILDYALNSAPVPLTKSVSYYIDEYGLPTSQSTSVGQVSAVVNITEQPASLMTMGMGTGDQVRIEHILRGRLVQVNLELSELEQKINAKKNKAASPGQDGQPTGGKAGNAAKSASDSKTGGSTTDPDSARFTNLLAEQQSLQTKLRYLGEQLRISQLKYPYMPVAPVPSVPSQILPFQLQQNALTMPLPVP